MHVICMMNRDMLAPDVLGHFSTDHDMAAGRDNAAIMQEVKTHMPVPCSSAGSAGFLSETWIPIHQPDYSID